MSSMRVDLLLYILLIGNTQLHVVFLIKPPFHVSKHFMCQKLKDHCWILSVVLLNPKMSINLGLPSVFLPDVSFGFVYTCCYLFQVT